MYLGIDVGATCLHCVAIGDDGVPVDARVVDSTDISSLAGEFRSARVVAIDAPSALSALPHVDDPDTKLSKKFRVARCAELALGREHGVWVPWVTPSSGPASAWMETGFSVFAEFQSTDADVIEVYPHAAFREVAGRLPPKRTAAGLTARVNALKALGVTQGSLDMWSHDGLDALMAALVARDRANGRAVEVRCGHDDSAIWLPAPEL